MKSSDDCSRPILRLSQVSACWNKAVKIPMITGPLNFCHIKRKEKKDYGEKNRKCNNDKLLQLFFLVTFTTNFSCRLGLIHCKKNGLYHLHARRRRYCLNIFSWLHLRNGIMCFKAISLTRNTQPTDNELPRILILMSSDVFCP
jgi:hypothetical protein